MDHNDYGGLHDDLKLTSAAMKRRDALKFAAGGMGALYLFGCADGLVGNDGVAGACEAIPEETAGRAVYVWHCDAAGRYSLYNSGATDQNYLPGVQESDASGELSFVTIFPGCYQGRWPHIHFEVFPSLEAATDEQKRIATSQLAFPEAACDETYATEGYEDSARAMQAVSLERDSVFRDGVARQMAAMTGDVRSGFAARLTVAVYGARR